MIYSVVAGRSLSLLLSYVYSSAAIPKILMFFFLLFFPLQYNPVYHLSIIVQHSQDHLISFMYRLYLCDMSMIISNYLPCPSVMCTSPNLRSASVISRQLDTCIQPGNRYVQINHSSHFRPSVYRLRFIISCLFHPLILFSVPYHRVPSSCTHFTSAFPYVTFYGSCRLPLISQLISLHLPSRTTPLTISFIIEISRCIKRPGCGYTLTLFLHILIYEG